MKIEITHRCRVDGNDCFPGDIVETSKGVALDRIGMGRAKKYVKPPHVPNIEKADDAEGVATEEEPKKKKKKGDMHDA